MIQVHLQLVLSVNLYDAVTRCACHVEVANVDLVDMCRSLLVYHIDLLAIQIHSTSIESISSLLLMFAEMFTPLFIYTRIYTVLAIQVKTSIGRVQNTDGICCSQHCPRLAGAH